MPLKCWLTLTARTTVVSTYAPYAIVEQALITQEHLKRATTLNKDQWLKERLEHKQKSSDFGITKSKNKIPLERFEQFAEFIEKYGYSIKYNQITFIEFLKN